MHIRTRQDAMSEEYIERIRRCDAVMFSGGNQLRLKCNRRWNRISQHFKEGIKGKISSLRNQCRGYGHEQYHDL